MTKGKLFYMTAPIDNSFVFSPHGGAGVIVSWEVELERGVDGA